jgi:hypothetical protein
MRGKIFQVQLNGFGGDVLQVKLDSFTHLRNTLHTRSHKAQAWPGTNRNNPSTIPASTAAKTSRIRPP